MLHFLPVVKRPLPKRNSHHTMSLCVCWANSCSGSAGTDSIADPRSALSLSRSETWVPKRGGLKAAGKRQESATFLQRSFFDVLLCSFSFAAAQLLVQIMTSALQKSQCCSAVSAKSQRSIPKTAAQLPFSLVACCRGGV